MVDSSSEPGSVVLSVEHLVKDFPGLRALDDVSLQVHAGEVVALLGQNGSGKSTLVKILAGIYTADGGLVTVGPPASPTGRTIHDALHFIHQDLGLIDTLSTVENLALGRPQGLKTMLPLPRRVERRRAVELLARFGVHIDVLAPVGLLTPAQRSIVAIVRAFDGWTEGPNVLILDEPTAALHGREVGLLFAAVREIARSGAGVVFISHRLDEVTELADRVVVLRDGRKVANCAAEGLDAEALAELITGHSQTSGESYADSPDTEATGEPVLVTHALAGGSLRSLDLTVRRGEIVGIAGSLGSGREDVAGLLYGSLRGVGGTVAVNGLRARRPSPSASLRRGIALVPADRRQHGGVMTHSVRENLSLPDLAAVCFGRVQLLTRRERAETRTWAERVGLRPMLPDRPLGLFSGGNQQKIVIARWLRVRPAILLVEEPTQGVDVGASESIRQLIIDAASDGMAVLVVSSDNADLIRMCTRVVVLRDGWPVSELRGHDINDHRLAQECLGISAEQLKQTAETSLERIDA